ncbi:hypothetical protein [Nucisporomicrobium flavum]|uniref:hypothetical protein n=1 Tax=Nucisporomicrobium flavum TaxID=2785915 RepID=UPI0018F7B175|nr:hypothetical protein [Nucisporomicrobium flavum]
MSFPTLSTVLSTVILTALPALPASAVAGSAVAPAPGHYRSVALGTLGGSSTMAFGLNDRSQVVGRSETSAGTFHPFLWQRGHLTDLGVLAAGPDESGTARDINARGDVVGGSRDAQGHMRAVLWRHGRITVLGSLSGTATALNDRGQVVGTQWTETTPPRGFIWQHGRLRDLGIAGPTEPLGINNRGQVVGWSGRGADGPRRAFLWDHGTVTWLATPGPDSSAGAINDRGEIVGGIGTTGGEQVPHAARWYRGTVTDLGVLPGGNASSATAINNRGVIVGVSNAEPYSIEEHAVLFRHGAVLDLVPAGIPQEAAAYVSGLNNRGEIIAAGILYRPAGCYRRAG